MATYAEQIAAFTADRGAKADRQKAIMDEALAKRARPSTRNSRKKFDTLQGEVEAIDKHLKRLHGRKYDRQGRRCLSRTDLGEGHDPRRRDASSSRLRRSWRRASRSRG
jgi:uncharacterized protein YlxW (UPF0749 family)